jgi:hypothetical protein
MVQEKTMAKLARLDGFEDEDDMALSFLFPVDGFGMVRVDAVPGDPYLLWLPFEPVRVEQRLM